MKKIQKNIRKFDSQEDFRDQERPPRHSERVTDEKITAPKAAAEKKEREKRGKTFFPPDSLFKNASVSRFIFPIFFS